MYLPSSPKSIKMKSVFLSAALFLVTSLTFISCGGKDKRKDDGATNNQTSIGPAKNNAVPKIDTANLKDEASILTAMQTFVDAKLANDKKVKENPDAPSYFVEFTTLETAILNAHTAYMKSLSDPNKSLEFHDKFAKIQGMLYAK
jgi:hypothetical protein